MMGVAKNFQILVNNNVLYDDKIKTIVSENTNVAILDCSA